MVDLPVLEIIPALLQLFETHNRVLLVAPPGAGKSTCVPLELLKQTSKSILMLEPRRLAAKAVASRLAFQMNESVGETVGYRIRFETKISNRTRIEVVTEGVFTRLLQDDPLLEKYGYVLFDEFHERSLTVDAAWAIARYIQNSVRPDLKLLMMSATVQIEQIKKAIPELQIIESNGRQFPIEVVYEPIDSTSALPNQLVLVVKKALKRKPKTILVFLPGVNEILKSKQALEIALPSLQIDTLFGEMPFEAQQKVLEQEIGLQRVVLSTSIAETSLTIPGVDMVIDSGFTRVPYFDLNTGFTKLKTNLITKDAADQRAGRAGRVEAGTVFRLWSLHQQDHLLPQRIPEILQADLTALCLFLLDWDSQSLQELPWIQFPPSNALEAAFAVLKALNAIDDEQKITSKGKEMLKWSIHPRAAAVLIEAKSKQMSKLAADAIALIEEKDIYNGNVPDVDLDTRLVILQNWRKQKSKNVGLERIQKISDGLSQEAPVYDPFHTSIGNILFAGYADRLVKKMSAKDSVYVSAKGKKYRLNDQDPLVQETYLLLLNASEGNQEGKIFLAVVFDPNQHQTSWEKRNICQWNETLGQIQMQEVFTLAGLIVAEKRSNAIDSNLKIELLQHVLKRSYATLLNMSEEFYNEVNRWQLAYQFEPQRFPMEPSIPFLLEGNFEWLISALEHVKSKEDFKKIELHKIMQEQLSWESKQWLDQNFPEKVKVPTGFEIGLQYISGKQDPVLAVRIQEIFGWVQTPLIYQGKIRICLHLLSPGYKPVQVTSDLKSFWQNAYHELRKSLKIRYPKHAWPEDPFKAQPVRGVPKKV